MRRTTFLAALTAALVLIAAHSEAAPFIQSFRVCKTSACAAFVDQPSINLNQPTNVTFFVAIGDLTSGQSVDPSGQLDVLDLQGKFKTFKKAKLTRLTQSDPTRLKTTVSITETTGGTLRLRIQVTIKPIDLRISSDTPETCEPCKVEIAKGQDLAPNNVQTTLPGDGNVTTTVNANTVGSRVKAAVAAAADTVVPPRPGLIRERVLDVIFEEKDPDANPLNHPLILRFPTSAVDGTCFVFAEETIVDSSSGGLETGFLGLTSGCATGGFIETDEKGFVDGNTDPFLPGIFGQGRRFVEVFQLTGSGYVSGKVCLPFDAAGNPISDCTAAGAIPRPGVRVKNLINNPGNQAFYTDSNGNYTVYVDGDSYQIEAVDAFRCRKKQDATSLTLPRPPKKGTLSQVTGKNLILDGGAPALTRNGIRNQSFEAGNLDCWTVVTGSASAVRGSSSTYKDLFGFNAIIKPSEEDTTMADEAVMMAMTPASGTAEVSQRFLLPARIFQDGTSNPEPQKLQFDFSFGCPSGTCPPSGADLSPITLTAEVRTVSPDSLIGTFSQTFKQFGGAFGWRSAEIPIRDGSATPAVADGTELKVVLRATGLPVGTAALIDNVRLDTVMVSVNLVGTGTTAAQIRAHVRAADEILSQAGLSVRLRRIKDWTATAPSFTGCDFAPDDATALRTLDYGTSTHTTSGKFLRTAEMKQMTCAGQQTNSDVPDSDVLAYYVDSFSGSSTVWGLALTPEDYEGNVELAVPARKTLGIIMKNLASDANRQRETPAHELGHFLLRPTAPDSREHGAAAAIVTTNNVCTPVGFGIQSTCSARPLFISTQAQQIDNQDAPFPAACPLFCKK